MILNVQPTQMRIVTAPEDSPILDPSEMAGWWQTRRAERTQPADLANLDPNRLAVPAARPRWPRLRRTSRVKSAATQLGA
jgi:hypothetical protein